jgi:hypothetical protein
MTEPTEERPHKKLKAMQMKEVFKVMKEAKAIQQRIAEGRATEAEQAEYKAHYAPIMEEWREMAKQNIAEPLANVAEALGSVGKELAGAISGLIEQAKGVYKSGKYYTILEEEQEYILIIDGKEKKRYPRIRNLDTQERFEEMLRIEAEINKLRPIKTRPQLLASFYALFVDSDKKPNTHERTPSSPLTKVLKDTLTHGVNLPSNKDTKTDVYHDRITNEYVVTYTSKNAEGKLYIPDLEQITSGNGKDIGARKILLYILAKANYQNFDDVITFQLSELVERGIYENERTAFKGVKKILDRFLSIQIEGKTTRGKNIISSQRSVLFTDNYISKRICTITCKGHVLKFLSQYFMLTPNWIYKLSKKAFLLADYIYYMARQKQSQDSIKRNDYFNISFKSINRELKNPEPEETNRHGQFIIDPLLNAIDEVERISQEEGSPIKVTPLYDEHYKTVKVFLQGYLQVELSTQEADYIKTIQTDRNEKVKKAIKKADQIKKYTNKKPS